MLPRYFNGSEMVLRSRIFSAHIVGIWLLLGLSMTHGTAPDIFCLRSTKDSLEDPHEYLQSSWNFYNNKEEGYICQFTGVECWHPSENRVSSLSLPNMGLKGQFPRSLRNCSSLIGLDLSNNKLSGTIPADISILLTFVTTLDLSSNHFSGEIPANLANCTFLNTLKLDRNRLTSQIPPELGLLPRLKTFNFTNNLLMGQVPNITNADIDSYINNPGLCGGPMVPCKAKSSKRNTAVIAGAAVGGAAIGLGIGIFFFVRAKVSLKKKRTLKGTNGQEV